MAERRAAKPEDHELEKKLQVLSVLETELAERELELLNVKGSLNSFEQKSKAELDPRYSELADLHAQIAELLSRQPAPEKPEPEPRPQPPRRPEQRKTSSYKPKSHAPRPQGKIETRRPPPSPAFAPAESIKRLYRDVAKAVHPDLADNDTARAN